MIIRKAIPDDLSKIQKLNYELFVHDNEFHHDLNVDWPYEPDGEAYFRRCIEGEEGTVSYVAEHEGDIVGYLNGALRKPHSAYVGVRAELENMCVAEKYRSQGIGSQLIDEFKKWAHTNGAERLIVEAFHGNDEAMRFYARNGFEGYAVTLSQDVHP